jgi:hypothetical protein
MLCTNCSVNEEHHVLARSVIKYFNYINLKCLFQAYLFVTSNIFFSKKLSCENECTLIFVSNFKNRHVKIGVIDDFSILLLTQLLKFHCKENSKQSLMDLEQLKIKNYF